MASSNFRVKNGAEITEVLYVSGASSLRNVGILGPVDPDVAGLTVHGDISATGTIFVAGSAVGGSSSSDFASGAGGSFNEIQYNNSGLLDGAGGLNYNETLQGLGIGVVANQKLTVAGNISSTGNIFTNGNITVDGTVDGRDIAGDAANVVANSGSWDSAYSSLKANSAEYESTFSTLLANSAEYESVLSTTRIYSADWTYVAENSAGASGDLTVAGRLTVGSDQVFQDNRLTVVGNISALGTIYAAGSAIGGAGTAGTPAGANKSIQYNDSGALNGGNFFYDEITERVGIGTSSPNKELTVIGSISSQDIFIGDTSPVITIKDTDSFGDTQLGNIQFTDTNDQVKGSIGFTNASDRNLRFTNNTEGDVRFLTNSAVSVAITSAGNVGIGTTTPDYELVVSGDIGVDQKIYHNGDSNTFLNFLDDRFKINVGGIVYLDCDDSTSAPHNLTVNDGSNNVDFIVKGTNNNQGNPLFKTDANTNRVGINGVGSPEAELEVDGTILATGSDPRIGVGTTAPGEALTVAGNVSANGDVFAKSVVVDNQTIIFREADGTIDRESGAKITTTDSGSIAIQASTVGVSSTPTVVVITSGGTVAAVASGQEASVEAEGFPSSFTSSVSTLATVFASGGDSRNWNSTYSNVNTNSADWTYVAQNSAEAGDRFKTIALSADRASAAVGADIVADSASDTVTLCAGPNIQLVSDPSTDTIMISSTPGAPFNSSELASNSANWNTSYTHSQGSVTDHNDVSNAGSGQIITSDERDRFGRTWTNLSTNSSQWAEVKADIAEVAALSATWNDAATNAYTVSADIAEIAAVSANWNTAYTRSDGTVTVHSDVSNAGSGQIITTDERDRFSRTWTNLSTNSSQWAEVKADIAEVAALSARYTRTALSVETNVVGSTANWNQSYITSNNNFSTLNSNSARWDTNANTELAAISARYTRTALSVETNVVPATGSWNSTNTTLKSLSTAAGTAVANKMLVVDGSKDINLDGGDLTATDVTVQGNLTVQGATIQADTVVTVTSALSVTNTGTGPALHVEQTGNNKVVEFLDDGVAVFSIANGGNITVKDNATVDGRDISVDGITTDNNFTTLNSNSAGYSRTESSMVNDVATTSANWNTAYTRSDGVVTIHSDVSNAGSGQIITTDERDRFGRTWTNVSGTSANWNTAYTHSQGNVTDHGDVSNAGSGQIITTDERDKFTRTWTNVSSNSARRDRTALSLETNVVGNSANWNTAYTHSQGSVTDHNDVSNAGSGQIITSDERDRFGRTWTNLSTNSSQWAEVKADIAEVAALSATWNDAATNAYAVSADIAEISALSGSWNRTESSMVNDVATTSANWNTAYTHSQGNVTDHGDVSNAGSGQIITTDERDKFTRNWTNVSTSSASWNDAATNAYAVSADIAEIAALSANWNTAYTRSDGVVTIHSDVSNAGSGQIITTDERDKFTRNWTNVSTSSASWNDAATNAYAVSADIAEIAALSANWNTAYTRSDGVVTIHSDVSNAGSGQIITTDERDKFTRNWTNVSTSSASWNDAATNAYAVSADIAEIAALSARWNRTESSMVNDVVGTSANWNTAYTHSQGSGSDHSLLGATAGTATASKALIVDSNKDIDLDGGDLTATNVTVAGDLTVQGATIQADTVVTVTSALSVTNTGTGPALHVEQKGNNKVVEFLDDGTSVFSIANGGNISVKSSATVDGRDISADGILIDRYFDDFTNIANVSGKWNRTESSMVNDVVTTSANWNTAYTHSQGNVTDHADVSNAGSGQIITTDERDKFTRNWTNVSTSSASWNDAATNAYAVSADIAEIAALSASWTTAYNSTQTELKSNSADWNYTAANSAITLDTSSHNYLSISNREITLGEVDISDDTNLAANAGVTLTGDTLSIDSVSASNFTAAYDHSRGNVTDHADVSNAGSGQIITADERDRFGRAWTNVSGNSAQYATIFNSSEIAAASARYTRTALSLETNVVPNTANWNYVAANSALSLDDVTGNGDSTTNNIQVGTATVTNDFNVKSGGSTLFTIDRSLSSAVYGTAPYNALNEFIIRHPDGGSGPAKLRLATNANTAYGQLWFSSTSQAYSGYGAVIEGTGEGVGVNVGALLFKVGFGTTPAEKMRVDSNGNVGINQTNPSHQLDVVGNTKIAGNITVTGTVDGRDVLADGGVLDRHKLDMANIAGVSANWTTGYNNSLSLEVARANVAATSGSWNSTNTTVKTYSADWNYVAANSGLTLDDVTGNGATTSNNIQVGDATITGDLTVQGATIQADTVVTVTSALSVTNTGTGPALHVEQKGNNKVVEFLDDGTAIFSIANGGAITVGTWNGTAIANDYVAALPTSKITSGTFANARIASSNVTQHQGDITGTGALNSGSITSGFGNINNGTSSLTTGAVIAQQLRVTTTSAPSAYTSSGTKGDIAYDTNYLYICVSNNSWRRVALAIWE